MTDRFHSLTVVLDRDIREDDADGIIAAIKQLRCVVDVKGNVTDISSTVAEARVRRELAEKLYAVLTPQHQGGGNGKA